jgi:hypothetical protein
MFGWTFVGKYLTGESRMKSKNNIKKKLNSLGIVSDGKKKSKVFETFFEFSYHRVK